jgi:hypothetical protein
MSNSKKVTKNAVDGMAAEVKKGGKKVAGVRGKTLVPSVTTKAPALIDQIEQDFNDVQTAHKAKLAAAKKVKEPKVVEPKIKERDPRLPEAGTPIVRKWRGHDVIVVEDRTGRFNVVLDGVDIGMAKSLTKAAVMVLTTEGITTGVNGYAWFNVGSPEKAPRANKSPVDPIQKKLKILWAKHAKAEAKANKIMADINFEMRLLADIGAAEVAENAADAAAEPLVIYAANEALDAIADESTNA